MEDKKYELIKTNAYYIGAASMGFALSIIGMFMQISKFEFLAMTLLASCFLLVGLIIFNLYQQKEED